MPSFKDFLDQLSPGVRFAIILFVGIAMGGVVLGRQWQEAQTMIDAQALIWAEIRETKGKAEAANVRLESLSAAIAERNWSNERTFADFRERLARIEDQRRR